MKTFEKKKSRCFSQKKKKKKKKKFGCIYTQYFRGLGG